MSALLMPTDRDKIIVEKALPGFMFALLFESLKKEGLEVRMDLEELANKASAAALAETAGAHQQKLAKIIENDGYDVLKYAGTDNVRILIGGLSRYLVKAKDEGCDIEENALLIALSIAMELDDGVTDWGSVNQINPVMARIGNNLRAKDYLSVISA